MVAVDHHRHNVDVPEELLELEVVDMNNELMDPLEWMTRKLISIPARYYWDTGIDPAGLPFRLKLWHRSVGFMGSIIRTIDRVGKPLVDFLGITSSRFHYVTSTMTETDWEYSRRVVQERRSQRHQDEVEDET